MTRLAATLGTTGIAAALMLAALQFLPPRDGGTAQAGTEPAALARAWSDPPRAAIPATATAPAAPAAQLPVRAAAPAAEPAPVAARSETQRPIRARAHLAARARRAHAVRTAMRQPAAVRARANPSAQTASAPVRMAGPVGDILHGLGLD